MGKRRSRADQAIDEVQDRARSAYATVVDRLEAVLGGGQRQTRKARRSIERAARKAERRLGRFWNRGRFRAGRIRKKATRQIDKTAKSLERALRRDK